MSSETVKMRAEFWEWVNEQGCDTDGAWSAWQAAWNRRSENVTPSAKADQMALAAMQGLISWDKSRDFIVPYKVRDPIHAAIKAIQANEGWKSVLADGMPPCDGEAVFVGINVAGYAACFNEMKSDGTCVMASPEDRVSLMSGLTWWRALDRPDA